MALLFLIMVVLPCALSKATIETNQLFLNTIKRWNIDIVSRSDHAERYRRFVKAQVSVDATSSGVMLTSLNKHTVMNDQEFDSTIGAVDRANRAYNWNNTVVNEEKRKFFQQREKRDALPESYMYWEDTVGFKDAGNQLSCGSCWAFPNTATMEALYKAKTGEAVEFSEQYFVDCAFSGSGCAGGTVKDGFDITKTRQYMRSAELSPYTADYVGCDYRDEIASFTNNALKKLWISDYVPCSGDEEHMLRGLLLSPVSFGAYISTNIHSYSGGLYDDAKCATEASTHAMLLVGYTETKLRVRNSYGTDHGENGYINYKRGSENLISCNFYKTAFALTVEYRRDYQYEFCSDKKLATRSACEASCKAMNTDTESGWTLAVIPSEYHNSYVKEMVEAVYPGVKTDEKFNLLWIGVEDLEKSNTFTRADGEPTNYGNMNWNGWKIGKYAVINKNSGFLVMKNSQTLKLRGICSRPINCWNIDSAVENGAVAFTDASLKEGTGAEVTCKEGYTLVGQGSLVCVAGKWDADLPVCEKEQEGEKKKEKKNKKKNKKDKKNKKNKKNKTKTTSAEYLHD